MSHQYVARGYVKCSMFKMIGFGNEMSKIAVQHNIQVSAIANRSGVFGKLVMFVASSTKEQRVKDFMVAVEQLFQDKNLKDWYMDYEQEDEDVQQCGFAAE